MFKNGLPLTELISRAHSSLSELYANPRILRPDNAPTVPDGHYPTRVYCAKCMGEHAYEHCFSASSRRSRSRFNENQDSQLIGSMRAQASFLKGRQKRKMRYMLADKAADRRERPQSCESDLAITIGSENSQEGEWIDSL